MRIFWLVTTIFFIYGISGSYATAQDATVSAPAGSTTRLPWSKETLDIVSRIPIQEGGRIKPLSTFARFKLVSFNGKTTTIDSQSRKISAMEWLLDCFFYPQAANQYKIFLIENPEVMQTLGLPDEKKRDRFSYDQVMTARDTIAQKGEEYHKIDSKQRTPFENQIVNLYESIIEYTKLIHAFEFARFQEKAEPGSTLAELLSDKPLDEPITANYSLLLAATP